jgi:hypothetical protein
MWFGDGGSQNAAPTYFGILPKIAGPTSEWSLLEWSKIQYLNPSAMQVRPVSTYDPLYGNAAYSWATPDGESAMQIYGNGTTTPWVYDLRSSGGILTNGGGTNVFLSDSTIAANANFGKQITYQLQAKIDTATVAYYSAAARSNGTVLAQVFSGFTLKFNQPGSSNYNAMLPTFNAFMQIGISNSSGPASARLPERQPGSGSQRDDVDLRPSPDGRPLAPVRRDGGRPDHANLLS